MTAPKFSSSNNRWLGREDSNLRMAESKSAALPLGDAPMSQDMPGNADAALIRNADHARLKRKQPRSRSGGTIAAARHDSNSFQGAVKSDNFYSFSI